MSSLPALRGGSLKLIRGLAARGVREVDIANALNFSLATWQRLKAGNPKVYAAFEEGRCEEHGALRGALFDSAMNGNVTAAIFLLKTRHGYNDQPQTQPEAGRVTVEFRLPAPLSPDQYLELTKVAEKAPAALVGAPND